MVRPQRPYETAREQNLSDESGGCSGAGEVAGETRPSQKASPQANAERVRREADKGRAMTTLAALQGRLHRPGGGHRADEVQEPLGGARLVQDASSRLAGHGDWTGRQARSAQETRATAS